MMLNNELQLSFPDGFRVMDEAELAGLKMIAEGPGCCVKDDSRHMVISVSWKKPGAFAGLLLSVNDLAASMEKYIRKGNAPFGYRLDEFRDITIGGHSARGIRYRYSVQGIEMLGESYVLKSGKQLYYFHLYTRSSLPDNLKIWESILNSAQWS